MLPPRGGGLILYQAYGNLYAMIEWWGERPRLNTKGDSYEKGTPTGRGRCRGSRGSTRANTVQSGGIGANTRTSDSNVIPLPGFENVSNDLENLLGSQRLDKNKEGLGYSAVSPPPVQVYSPPKKDLSWTGLPEFVDDTVTNYSRPTPSIDTSNSVTSDLQSNNSSVSELRESSCSIMSKPMIKFVKAADCPKVTKTNNIENAKKSTYTCKQKRQLNDKRKEKPMWNNAGRVNHQNSPRITHPNLKRHMVPRKILTRSGPISFNTARQSHLNAVCCCCSRQVNTARPKAVINVVRTNRVNDVKASAC
nr:hypothetical protein [Tanacetum cinerariifolium]